MSSEQDISIRIESCDVMVEILGGVVVAIFVAEILHQARRVASVCSCLAVTDLQPPARSTCSTAATEEEVVIHFVLGRGLLSVEYRR